MTHFWLWTGIYLGAAIGAALATGRFLHYCSEADKQQSFIDSLEEVERRVEEARARIR